MKIEIFFEKEKIIFSYLSNNIYFIHSITTQKKPHDEALFRIALFSRPENCDFYEFPNISISEESLIFFEKQYQCKILIKIKNIHAKFSFDFHQNTYLGFSGGFDSLAALALMPETTQLQSINFGEKFKREKDFFSTFDTTIIHWDIRKKSKNFIEKNDWKFLLSPLLTNWDDFSKGISICTGTIMEASTFWFSAQKRFGKRTYSNGGFGPGVNIVHPVAGLTEWGTAMITAKSIDFESCQKSLKSLADTNTIKSYRKTLLLSIINQEVTPAPSENMKKHIFGTSLTEDSLTLYFVWKLGYEWTIKNYSQNTPKESTFLDMSFMEKMNLHNLEYNSPLIKEYIKSRAKGFQIEEYDYSDYKSLEKCKNFIFQYKEKQKTAP